MNLPTVRRRLNPRKLLHSKWTAVHPERREKHFLVIECLAPPDDEEATESVVLEAVHSGRTRILPWQQLQDSTIWLQGWK